MSDHEPQLLRNTLKKQIIDRLNLVEVTPDQIKNDQTLFGDGLGLDSIDALELIVLLDREYGIKITDPKKGQEVFQTIDTMAEHIIAHS